MHFILTDNADQRKTDASSSSKIQAVSMESEGKGENKIVLHLHVAYVFTPRPQQTFAVVLYIWYGAVVGVEEHWDVVAYNYCSS